MYESPIKIIEFENAYRMQLEDNIFKTIKNVGIVVDKEELLRALEFDRGQYNKGYKDGINDVCKRIIDKLEEQKENPTLYVYAYDAYNKAIKFVKEEMK
jgi:ADP-glucose pyrophosphorylase